MSILFRAAGPDATAVDFKRPRPSLVHEVPFTVRLEIVRDLLGALEQATGAGQAHLMDRAIGVLRQALLSPELWLTPAQRVAAATLMDDLDHELGRAAPRFASFREHAYRLVDLLAAATSGSTES